MLATSVTANGLSQSHTIKITTKESKQLGTCIKVCHFNAEGLSKAKSECIGRGMSDNKIDILAQQETHCSDDELGARGHIPGFQLVGSVGHGVYGIATYVLKHLSPMKAVII